MTSRARKLWHILRRPWRPAPLQMPSPLAAVLAFLLASYLQEVRRIGDPPLWNAVFAEDGDVFITGAVTSTLPQPVFESYGGYLHVVPRLVTEVAVLFPIEHVPLVMSLLTAAIVSALALYVFVASSAWIASPWARGAIAALMVLLPATAFEMNGVLANLHWYLLFTCFWAVLCPSTSTFWVVVSSTIALLTALSDPLAALLLPVGVVRILGSRGWRVAIPTAAMSLGLALQVILTSGSAESLAESHPEDLPWLFAQRVAASLFAGDRFIDPLVTGQLGKAFAWACLAVLVAGFTWLLWRSRSRPLVAAGGLLAVAFFCAVLLVRGTETLEPGNPGGLAGSRYVYLPLMFLITGIAAGLDGVTTRPAVARRAALVLGTVGAALVVSNYSLPHAAIGGDVWKPRVSEAREACKRLDPNALQEVEISIGPGSGLWEARVGCERLEE